MPEHDELFVRWELGLTDAADEASLAEALKDPSVRRDFVRSARVAAALGAPATLSAPPPSERVFTRGTTRQRKAFRIRSPRASRWSRVAVAASVALVAGVIALLVVTSHPPITSPNTRQQTPPPAFARLLGGDGTHITSADGRERPAQRDATLAPGDLITVTNATTVVLGKDAARLELAAGSRLLLPAEAGDPLTDAVRLRLDQGSVTAEVATRRAGAPFTIATPLASVEVIGTRFTFSLADQEAHLAVDHGAVRLSAPGDTGVVVSAGRTALVSEGLVSIAPPAPATAPPAPADSDVLWRVGTDTIPGWRGVVETAPGGMTAWRSVAPRAGDIWSRAELRSPVTRTGWTVASSTWLRFRYHVERFSPGLALEVHLKPKDESNYAFRLTTDTSDGWHEALLRIDGSFRKIDAPHAPLPVGEVIHGAVWCAMRGGEVEATPARFWIRDVVVFARP